MRVFLVFLFLISASANAAEYPTLIGKTLDGKNFDLKEKRGSILLINFWATWCIDCRKELPILDEIYKDYRAQGLEIIGISTDSKKQRAAVLEISEGKKYSNLMLSDVTKNDFPEVEFLPTTYLLDRNGKMIGVIVVDDRAITKKDFEEVLKPLLARTKD